MIRRNEREYQNAGESAYRFESKFHHIGKSGNERRKKIVEIVLRKFLDICSMLQANTWNLMAFQFAAFEPSGYENYFFSSGRLNALQSETLHLICYYYLICHQEKGNSFACYTNMIDRKL